jgi:hypothetical protein
MALALDHYRRVSELYMELGNRGGGDEAMAEFQVKLDAGRDALLDAAGSAVGVNGLSLSGSQRADLRKFTETVFPSELRAVDLNRNNPSFTAGSDIWALELLRGTLNKSRRGT